MGVSKLKVIFNNPDKVFYPGQVLSGRVEFLTDSVTKVKGVELKLKGRAKCKLDKEEDYRDSDGRSHTRTITVKESETYLKNEMRLAGGKGEFELSVGEHQYPFSMVLPYRTPSTFNGSHGSVQYYAKVKIDIPWAMDPTQKEQFFVKNLLNLNMYPNLKSSFKDEKTKTFCCLCCTSGPLSVAVHLPKTGYAKNETIPVTVEIDNASNVAVDSVKAYLERKIHYKAEGEHKEEEHKLTKLLLGALGEGQSQTFCENITIPNTDFPNLEECRIITITHRLHIEADASGMHSDLDLKIALTIGDIPLCEDENAALSLYPQGYPVANQQNNPGLPYQPGVNLANPGNFQTPIYPGQVMPQMPVPMFVPGQMPAPGYPMPVQNQPPQIPMPGYPNSQMPGSAYPNSQMPPAPGVYPPMSSNAYSQNSYPNQTHQNSYPGQIPQNPYPAPNPPMSVSSYPTRYNNAAGDNCPKVQPAFNPEFSQAHYPGDLKSEDKDLTVPSFNNSNIGLEKTSFLSDGKPEEKDNQFTPLLPSMPSAPPPS